MRMWEEAEVTKKKLCLSWGFLPLQTILKGKLVVILCNVPPSRQNRKLQQILSCNLRHSVILVKESERGLWVISQTHTDGPLRPLCVAWLPNWVNKVMMLLLSSSHQVPRLQWQGSTSALKVKLSLCAVMFLILSCVITVQHGSAHGRQQWSDK